jgi:heat shock protein HtpX
MHGTPLRTWLLVAGPTALLIAVGAPAGGLLLYVLVGLAVLVNVAGYLFSDRVALGAGRASLSGRAGIPKPRLFLIPSEQHPANSASAASQGLVSSMPPAEVEAAIAHELAHVPNRDALVSSIAAMIAGAIAAIASVPQSTLLFGRDEDDRPLGRPGTLAMLIPARAA